MHLGEWVNKGFWKKKAQEICFKCFLLLSIYYKLDTFMYFSLLFLSAIIPIIQKRKNGPFD